MAINVHLTCSDPDRSHTFGVASAMQLAAVQIGETISSGATQTEVDGYVVACAAMLLSSLEDQGIDRAEILRRLESDLDLVKKDYHSYLAEQQKEQN